MEPMQNQMQERLMQLRHEFESGQKLLAELDARREATQQTLLRISGAIQVLEELIQTQAPAKDPEKQAPQ